ncbi:MAG TPA: response regulator transcription factor [Solirubrobacteraceae bacterium]|nr:response regulator transcription factor [Solirubrobacteraceae bacterium]
MSIRVVLAEDSYLAREGIRRVLEEEQDIEIVATCGDLGSLRAAVVETAPDVVLTDIRMPPTNTDEGVALAAELWTSHPDVGVVVISHYDEPVYATQLLERGSRGRAYLLKERVQDVDELHRTIHDVARGGSVVDARIVERLLAAQQRREHGRLETLTPREHEILALVAEGWSNAAIADRVFITKRAVERHIHSIFWKLDLGDPDTSGRVKAALLYLAGQQTSAGHSAVS